VSGGVLVTIVDHLSGRGLGGHYDDYLAALEAALADDFELRTIAPFRDGVPEPRGRPGIYRLEISDYRKALTTPGGAAASAAIVHSAEFSDYVCCRLAASTIRRSRRAPCLFVLRRSPDPATLAGPGGRFGKRLVGLIAGMIRGGQIVAVSDSQPALDAWLALAPGRKGALVALPPAPGAAGEGADAAGGEPPATRPTGGPLVAVAGRMRAEKGAAHYPDVAAAALTALPGSRVALQVSQHDAASRVAVVELRRAYEGDDRVVLLDEHLTAGQYRALLREADIVVLPYDAATYGTGTSGVITDALSQGAKVVVTPIEWARHVYGDDDRVVWLEDPGSGEAIAKALQDAASRDTGPGTEDQTAAFADSWRVAVRRVAGESATKPDLGPKSGNQH
jgi:glycosyltransferase involved in cell wall biosynthesis